MGGFGTERLSGMIGSLYGEPLLRGNGDKGHHYVIGQSASVYTVHMFLRNKFKIQLPLIRTSIIKFIMSYLSRYDFLMLYPHPLSNDTVETIKVQYILML